MRYVMHIDRTDDYTFCVTETWPVEDDAPSPEELEAKITHLVLEFKKLNKRWPDNELSLFGQRWSVDSFFDNQGAAKFRVQTLEDWFAQ